MKTWRVMTERAIAIDLNSDLGESYGRWTLGDDAALVPHITSANLACGFHAGEPSVMDRTVALCKAAGVGVGAQPGHHDLLGFGRRPILIPPKTRSGWCCTRSGRCTRSAARTAWI